MASLIPILQDILPIFRRGKVQVVRSTQLDEGTNQTEGMIRKGAIVGMSDHICASGGLFRKYVLTELCHVMTVSLLVDLSFLSNNVQNLSFDQNGLVTSHT